MEMSIADDTDEGLFVGYDGEMTKLHNMPACEAGHLMVSIHHITASCNIFHILCIMNLQQIHPTHSEFYPDMLRRELP